MDGENACVRKIGARGVERTKRGEREREREVNCPEKYKQRTLSVRVS